jgi:hypothetical protein
MLCSGSPFAIRENIVPQNLAQAIADLWASSAVKISALKTVIDVTEQAQHHDLDTILRPSFGRAKETPRGFSHVIPHDRHKEDCDTTACGLNLPEPCIMHVLLYNQVRSREHIQQGHVETAVPFRACVRLRRVGNFSCPRRNMTFLHRRAQNRRL